MRAGARSQESGVRSQRDTLRKAGSDARSLSRLAALALLLLTSDFWLLTPALAATHVTASYDLGANPRVMATVNGTPQYGLVFAQRNKAVLYNGTEYGTAVLKGYLNASGQLNDGAGHAWLDLIPNPASTPSDSYYVVTVNIQGQVHSEIWVVPDVPTVDAAAVRVTQTPFGGGAAFDLSRATGLLAILHLSPPSPCTSNQVLKWDGQAWVCATGGAGGATQKVNDVDLLAQDVVNFQDSTELAWTNPSAGNVQAALKTGSVAESKLALNYPTHSNANDPTSGQKAALAGTTGTPGDTNRYVTDADARNSNARTPTAHVHAESDVTSLVTDLAGKEAIANKNTANGYAGLDASSRISGSQIPYGTGTNTAAQGNDSRITGAEQTANKNAANGYAGLDSGSRIAKAQAPSTTAYTDASNTWSTGAQDFGSATSLKVPVAAGAAPATNGFIAYDSTANQFKGGLSSATVKFPTFSIANPTAGNCVQWAANGTLGDYGSGCGGGGGTNHNLLSGTHPDTVASSPVLGGIIAANSTPAWQQVSGNTTTTKKFLTQTGNGTISALPAWNTIAAGDIPDLSATYQAVSGKNAANGYAGLDASSKLTGSQLPYGTSANTAAQGNDSRITGAEQTANKNAANGYAGLDSGSRIAKAQAPSTTVYTDASNTWSTGAQDFGSATSLKVPTSAGAAPAAVGLVAYDSTANTYKGYNGSATKTFAFTDSNITGTAAGLSATLGLSSGGTNQTSWTGSRCVQVNSAGTALESASGACGTGGGGSPGGSGNEIQYRIDGSTFGGAANSSFNSTTGVFTFNQKADTNNLIWGKRYTDTSPTGSFVLFRNAGDTADLFKIGVDGSITQGGSGPWSVETTPGSCAVSGTGKVKLCADSTGNRWRMSYNGGAYVDLLKTGEGGGISSLNGLTDATQTFATPGTSGTAPNWSSGSGAHTLNIPMASTASVTAGLISKTNYDTFNGKPDLVAAGTAGTAAYNAGNAATAARSDHTHRVINSLRWFFPGTVVAGVQTARALVPEGVTNCILTNSRISVNTTGSTATTWNIARCTTAAGDCTATSNIYSSAVTLNASTQSVAGGTPNTTTVTAGDAFLVNLVTVGTGLADVTIALTYKCECTN